MPVTYGYNNFLKRMRCIDLNCDMGEGCGNDADIMPYISSANIACGYHAGDEPTIKQTIQHALRYNIAIGAHPGFNDKPNFGRTEQQLAYDEVYTLVLQQIQLLQKLAALYNAKLHHVKPHGALYNMAAKNAEMAAAIAQAVKQADRKLVLYGLNNSLLITEAQKAGLQTANEVFADRHYNGDGSLVTRQKKGALIEDDEEAIRQVLTMVKNKEVISIDGRKVPVYAQTICLHGDGTHAVTFVREIREALIAEGITIQTV